MKKPAGGGSAPKHKGPFKYWPYPKPKHQHHHAHAKHNHPPAHHHKPVKVHKPPHHAHHHKPRKLALAGMVACCAAEALAASIRLAGGSVAEADVLALYQATCSDPDEGQSLSVALSAAQAHSLAGYYPVFRPLQAADLLDHREGSFCLCGVSEIVAVSDFPGDTEQDIFLRDLFSELDAADLGQQPAGHLGAGGEVGVGLAAGPVSVHALILGPEDGRGGRLEPPGLRRAQRERPDRLRHDAVILGVDLPGSHAVCVGPDGAWWSWGEPYDPAAWPDAVIEEAWAVTWA